FSRRFSHGVQHPHGVDVRQSARTAVLAGWLRMRLGERDPAALERPLVDPKLTSALAEILAESKKLAGAAALAHYRVRLTNKAKGQTELQRLLADVQKKRYRPTLRQLYERHGPALALARPIWFCSPEAVAALFPLVSSLFDLVIFDEASQCPVEAAIPALVRGRVAMIAGDDQQMPPSHFFAASLDDGDDEGEEGALLAAQSILNLARVALPTTTLSWHYRCRHEELIAFSNTAFYGKKLATAPNAEGRERLRCEGLRCVAVDGRWKDQTNSAEADRVVELVAEILSESLPSGQPPTLGIVAMNRPQAELIERRIEARQASDEAFREVLQRDLERPLIDQLFVRNLENVQGDERDIMILSLAYGPSEKGGKVAVRFGPLGLDGGEKRLNVAITRARLGLTVVASCQPEDLAVEGTTHPGPKLLKSFLAFVRATARGGLEEARELLERAAAQSGVATPNKRAKALEVPGRRLADVIAKALDQRGLIVAREIGLGRLSLDLAVRRPDDPVFRVALDTSGYLSRRHALLRDHHVPVFWQRVGWRILRVTPGAWRRDPAAVIRRIEDALNPTKGGRSKA
ncbi:MAG TPA: AAA domain-containing protein, partial [Myxococcota bacterium]|nr:AAA domain-containing protein [Myxococcota bacterium]